MPRQMLVSSGEGSQVLRESLADDDTVKLSCDWPGLERAAIELSGDPSTWTDAQAKELAPPPSVAVNTGDESGRWDRTPATFAPDVLPRIIKPAVS